MKKFSLSIVAILSLVCGLSVLAATQVMIRGEKPVTIMREGEILMVPEKATARYYYHTVNNTKYVCTVEEPVELVDVNAMMVEVKMGGETKKVRCYPEVNFVIE